MLLLKLLQSLQAGRGTSRLAGGHHAQQVAERFALFGEVRMLHERCQLAQRNCSPNLRVVKRRPPQAEASFHRLPHRRLLDRVHAGFEEADAENQNGTVK